MTPEEAAANADFGAPSAHKRGRYPDRPYVPVLLFAGPRPRQQQILGVAYPTRVEAVKAAERHVEDERRRLERKLRDPRYRALRDYHGVIG